MSQVDGQGPEEGRKTPQFGSTPPSVGEGFEYGLSPMTSLAASFQTHQLSPRRRRSPMKKSAFRKSGSHIYRARHDENAPNRPVSPLQFDMSPLPSPSGRMKVPIPISRMAPPGALPAPATPAREAAPEMDDVDWALSRSSSSEMSQSDSMVTDPEDEFLASLSSGDRSHSRRFISMSAQNLSGLYSPDVAEEEEEEEEEAAGKAEKKPSPVKKNLFNAGADVFDDDQTFRWERSASMMDLSARHQPPQQKPLQPPRPPSRGLSPPIVSPVNLSSVPTILARSQLRSSGTSVMTARAPNAMPAYDPLRRRGSVMTLEHTSNRLDRRSGSHIERKRVREGMPTPNLERKGSDSTTPTMSEGPSAPVYREQELPLPVTLPTVQNLKHDGLMTITCSTVRDILLGRYTQAFDKVFILDCRFDYEFEGGHIRGAVHANNPQVLVDQFFKERVEGRVCFIFHCEFSSKRGPSQLRLMRELDRKANQNHYPHLFYPELYLMGGGYCEFFKQFPKLCDPQAYLTMDDERFRDRLRGNLQITNTFAKKKRRPSIVTTELLGEL